MQQSTENQFAQDKFPVGWLFFYCLSRALLEPLYLFYSLPKLHGELQKGVEASFALFGIIAVCLIYRRTTVAFKMIVLDLILRSCFATIVFLTLLLHPLNNRNTQTTHFITATIVAGVQFGSILAWFLYFRTSRRVRALLGRNLLPKTNKPNTST